MSKVDKILGEKHARKIVDSAIEDLALVRRWVWEHKHSWLPADGNAAPDTRHEAEAHGGYSAWYATLDAALKVLDAGEDLLSPKTEAERQEMLKRIDEARAARLARKNEG